MRELALTITDNQLMVTWMVPSMPNGPEIISYNVTLSGINLIDMSPINIMSNTATVTDTMYTANHSSTPYSNYTAVVVAFTSAGASPEEVDSEVTPAEGEYIGKDKYNFCTQIMHKFLIFFLAPTAVRELTLTITDNQLMVTWMVPSMPNGPESISYNVTLSGIVLVDMSPIAITPDSATVTDTVYTVNHTSTPYSNYTAVVVAFTSAGASAERTFTEQFPEAGDSMSLLYYSPIEFTF